MRFENGKNLMPLHKDFARTEYGQKLGHNIRYERYKPSGIGKDRWEDLLGADVNNLHHLSLTYGLTRIFVNKMNEARPGALSNDDTELLITAAIIHDWGESIIGDITYDDKTLAGVNEEHMHFVDHLDDFYTGNSVEMREQILTAVDEIVFDSTTELGRMFNAIERVGYIRTALRANEHIINGTALDCEENLRWLVVDVLSRHPGELASLADELPPIREYLLSQNVLISQAFEMVEPSVYSFYGDQAVRKQWMVDKSYKTWHSWIEKQNYVTANF